uniref:Pleckstrin homology domain containing B1 n=1 Tax=Pipistrellus kuhlii TaxID=59472 RepID=A0A7J7X190_PIPKU|nr:pleckstrin homology domain containing B1 [Pipistrellus kuhlii]
MGKLTLKELGRLRCWRRIPPRCASTARTRTTTRWCRPMRTTPLTFEATTDRPTDSPTQAPEASRTWWCGRTPATAREPRWPWACSRGRPPGRRWARSCGRPVGSEPRDSARLSA